MTMESIRLRLNVEIDLCKLIACEIYFNTELNSFIHVNAWIPKRLATYIILR